MIDNMIKDLGAFNDTLKDLENEKGVIDRQIKSVKDMREALFAKIANEMIENGVHSTDVDGVRWSVRNVPPSVIITDEATIPPKYIREKITKAPDKVLIKAALVNGETIQGATLSNGSITLTQKGIT
jgi:hypothetical protein